MNFPVFILGFIGITAQSSFLREILAQFVTGELVFGAALFFWLVWTATGSAILGRLIGKPRNATSLFYRILPFYGLFAFAGVLLTASMHDFGGLVQGERIPLDMQLIAVALVFMPFNLSGGFLFALAVKMQECDGIKSAGKAFTLESAGSALAGIAVSLFLIPFFPNKIIAFSCPVLAIMVSAVYQYKKGMYLELSWPLAAGFAVLLIAGWHHVKQTNEPSYIVCKESPYGRIGISQEGESLTFYENATALFSYPDIEAVEYAVHLAFACTSDIRRALFIGGSMGGAVSEALKYPKIEAVDAVEIDPVMLDLAIEHMADFDCSRSGVNYHRTDGRAFLAKMDERYDVIILSIPEPLSGATNRYYTREFFELLSSRMTAQGVVFFSVEGEENYVPDDLASFLASIRRTLREVFPTVTVLPGATVRFIAGKERGALESLDGAFLSRELEKRGIETEFVNSNYITHIYSPHRIAAFTKTLDSAGETDINTDLHPTAYLSRALIHARQDSSRSTAFLKVLLKRNRLILLIVILTVVCAAFTLIPGKSAGKRGLFAAIGTLGMSEISLELLAVMAYQARFGHLYGRITLLIGLYMAGLAAGSFLSSRAVESGTSDTSLLAKVQAFMALIPILWIVVLFIPQHAVINRSFVEMLFFVLPCMAGAAGGYQFPLADALYRQNDRKGNEQGTLYGADLFGSSLGAMLTGTLLIPGLGMIPTLVFLSCLNLLMSTALYFNVRARR